MAAPKGNKFWMVRSKHGRDKKHTPESLWLAALEYFEWVEANPLHESRLVSAGGSPVIKKLPKMRAMTLEGFALFANLSSARVFREYQAKEGFQPICEQIAECIRLQKFTGAAADLLNASIIARDLGLKDHQDIDLGRKPRKAQDLTDDELARIVQEGGKSG